VIDTRSDEESEEYSALCSEEIAEGLEQSNEILLNVYGMGIETIDKVQTDNEILPSRITFTLPRQLVEQIIQESENEIVEDSEDDNMTRFDWGKTVYRMQWGYPGTTKVSCHDFKAYTWADATTIALAWALKHGVGAFGMHQAKCHCSKTVICK